MRDFNAWLGEFRSSIADYKYYIDFPKVFANVDALRIELNILNSLIGSRNIEADFENIIERYPETLKCIPILLAKREMDIFAMDEEGAFCYNFVARNYPTSQYKVFMRKTGLFDLMEKHLINNLVDLSSISNNGSAEKRFDFVIKCPNMIYGIETNFYSSPGSKLNETARSYKTITLETRDLDFFKFVWFTDGQGWINARNNLKETFDVLENLYNIKDLEDGVISNLIQE